MSIKEHGTVNISYEISKRCTGCPRNPSAPSPENSQCGIDDIVTAITTGYGNIFIAKFHGDTSQEISLYRDQDVSVRPISMTDFLGRPKGEKYEIICYKRRNLLQAGQQGNASVKVFHDIATKT